MFCHGSSLKRASQGGDNWVHSIYDNWVHCTDIYTEDQYNDSLKNITKTNTMTHMTKVRYETICNNHRTSPKRAATLWFSNPTYIPKITRVRWKKRGMSLWHLYKLKIYKGSSLSSHFRWIQGKRENDMNDNLGVTVLAFHFFSIKYFIC